MVSNFSKKPAKCLAVLGTASDVGKSIVVTALCRVFKDMGLNVAPFKAQNMSNNSFVTSAGGEIGRAQVAQAEAALLEPHVDMNPVLLKPNSDLGAQIILDGKAIGERSASAYGNITAKLTKHAAASLERLREQYELVVMEGAGSCAEINLKERDFVNFKMAQIGDAPVILVADIDRGGVFAQIIGTLDIITPKERARVKGIIINRFRGDLSLFDDGISYIEERTGIPVLGVIPHIRDIGVDSEDAVVLQSKNKSMAPSLEPALGKVNIAIVMLPHISNFTDFAPLENNPSVKLDYLFSPRTLQNYDQVILPGTKNVRGDLSRLRELLWEPILADYVRTGGRLCGICGGYQMLGKTIDDPYGVEGKPGSTQGLNYLDVATTLDRDKILTRAEGTWLANKVAVVGYEIHQGTTTRCNDIPAALQLNLKNGQPSQELDGAVSRSGRIWGTYLHGIFDNPKFCTAFLTNLRPELAQTLAANNCVNAHEARNLSYDRLADCIRSCLNMDQLLEILDMKIKPH